MNNSGKDPVVEKMSENKNANGAALETLALDSSRKLQDTSIAREFPKAPENSKTDASKNSARNKNSEPLRGIVEAGALLIKDGPKQFTLDLPSGEKLLFSVQKTGIRKWSLEDQSGLEIANSDIGPEKGKKQLSNHASLEATHVVVDKFWGFYDEHWSIDYCNSDKIDIEFVFGPEHKTRVHMRRTTMIGEVEYDFKFKLGAYS